MGFTAHETAVIEDGAVIGDGTKVWHHAHVMRGARIGAGCTLSKDVFVARGAIIGDRVKIQNGVSIYDGVTLEDEVFVGPHAVFTNVEQPRAAIDRKHEIALTRVGRGATLGAGAVIVCGHTIGEYAFIGAGAVVVGDIQPFALVVGNPGVRIGWVSRAGRRLHDGLGVVKCPETHEEYVITKEGCRIRTPEPPAPAPDRNDSGPHAIRERIILPPGRIGLQNLIAESRFFERALRTAFDRVLASGQFVLGSEVTELERRVSERLRCAHAVAVSSGTDAILSTLMALGIGPGDEVITTPVSFFATTAAILRMGAKPVFADIDPDTQNLDPERVRAAITPRTRAILVVHLFGLPADPAIFDLGRERSIPVIEDAAQAFGARTNHGFVGTLGEAGCFSFFPTKNLGALGDAGMVTTNDKTLADRIRILRAQGAEPRYNHIAIGGNFRMDALQAAFLLAKLPKLDELQRRRLESARRYREAFAELLERDLVKLPHHHETHVFHQYVIRTRDRDALAHYLHTKGIETAVYYPKPIHLMPALDRPIDAPAEELPNAVRACAENLALPVHPWLEGAQRDAVIVAVRSFFSG